jgi:SAM-dependent MidA family methyltransferase
LELEKHDNKIASFLVSYYTGVVASLSSRNAAVIEKIRTDDRMQQDRQQQFVGFQEWIRGELASYPGGKAPFHDYMAWCLYYPEFGYYMNDRVKIGKEGDFYTSSNLGGFMGECLASYVRQSFANDEGEVYLVEWGGGTGSLALSLLDSICTEDPELYSRLKYISVEASPQHRRLQRQHLESHQDRILWLEEAEFYASAPWRKTLLFSNELPDAFPVHRIMVRGGVWHECFVSWDTANREIKESYVPLGDGEVADYLIREGAPLREGQIFEVNLQAQHWLRSILGAVEQGEVMTIDYGDVSEELYAAHRMNGTLMCYYRHLASDTPFQRPGEQDMTSHVNYSALIRTGQEAGVSSWRFLTQKQFLVENGLLDKLREHSGRDPFSEEARRNRMIRQLLLSDSMSELFKVLIQTKP